MKKIFVSIVTLMAIVLFIVGHGEAAVGKCTQSKKRLCKGTYEITFDCTANTSDGTFPNDSTMDSDATYITPILKGKSLVSLETVPSGTPTTLYDIDIKDTDGGEITGGVLHDRSTSAVEFATPYVGSSSNFPIIRGTIRYGDIARGLMMIFYPLNRGWNGGDVATG